MAFNAERRRAQMKLEGQNPYRPQVHFLVVFLPSQQFRRQVQGRPTKSAPQLAFLVHSPPEVAEFYRALCYDKYTWTRTMF